MSSIHQSTGTVTGSPRLDPYELLPEMAELRTAVAGRRWPAVQAFFDARTPADQTYAAVLVSETAGVESFLAEAAAAHPAAPLPRTLLAYRQVVIGWDIRSADRARNVSRDQFRKFHDWLRKAEQLLIDVCAEQPAFPLAWYVRLITARGLELGQSEARRRHDRLAAVSPHHHAAQSQLLQQLCPKWGGTWELAHGFARECASAAPDGSDCAVLVADAHIEHWLDLPSSEDEAYMRGVPVRDDLRFAAEVSVWHPAYRPDANWISAHNTFAMAFSLGGHLQDAARHFAVLGDRACRSPWNYLGDPKAMFAKHRRAALTAR
ncbi:hypothetical protein [Streptomyces abyssomicinicus]|uniref:hypothetical protein n=1 Tax=Streptomyces abyssomicinicus TaxID=574929 RepID=UPI00124F7B34|nr:hypothetical protein [Streptomyces abyssomicinicus]